MTDRPSTVQSVRIYAPAAATMRHEAARSRDGNETGGILLGRLHPEGTIAIRHAGAPGPVAVRQPTFFLRDLDHAQRLAACASARDGSVWIGEWHTHPGGTAVPSDRDLDTYEQLLADVDLDFDVIVSIILTAPHSDWAQPIAHGWACYPSRAEGIPLVMHQQQTCHRRQ